MDSAQYELERGDAKVNRFYEEQKFHEERQRLVAENRRQILVEEQLRLAGVKKSETTNDLHGVAIPPQPKVQGAAPMVDSTTNAPKHFGVDLKLKTVSGNFRRVTFLGFTCEESSPKYQPFRNWLLPIYFDGGRTGAFMSDGTDVISYKDGAGDSVRLVSDADMPAFYRRAVDNRNSFNPLVLEVHPIASVQCDSIEGDVAPNIAYLRRYGAGENAALSPAVAAAPAIASAPVPIATKLALPIDEKQAIAPNLALPIRSNVHRYGKFRWALGVTAALSFILLFVHPVLAISNFVTIFYLTNIALKETSLLKLLSLECSDLLGEDEKAEAAAEDVAIATMMIAEKKKKEEEETKLPQAQPCGSLGLCRACLSANLPARCATHLPAKASEGMFAFLFPSDTKRK